MLDPSCGAAATARVVPVTPLWRRLDMGSRLLISLQQRQEVLSGVGTPASVAATRVLGLKDEDFARGWAWSKRVMRKMK